MANDPMVPLPVKWHGKLDSYMQARLVAEKLHGATRKAGCEPVGKITPPGKLDSAVLRQNKILSFPLFK